MQIRKTLLFAILILTAGALEAQDFWLIPDYSAQPGRKIRITARKGGNFPAGDVVAADGIARLEIIGADGRTPIPAASAEAEGQKAGGYVAAAEFRPGVVRYAAGELERLLEREGASGLLEKLAKNDKGAGVLAAGYAKAVFDVKDRSAGIVTKPVGLKLEIVPEVDPAEVRPGEKLPVRVLFDGKPLENAQVAGLSDAWTDDKADGEDHTFLARTGYQGIAMIPIWNPGTWVVRLVHVVSASEGKDHQYESYSSSLTFRIPPEQGFPLTVDSIMRGPDLVGYGIRGLRWSGDSSKLYFDWRRPEQKKSHTWSVSREDGKPVLLSDEEARNTIPERGDYTKDHKQMVFAENGDIVLQDTVTNERRYLVRTVDAESSSAFTRDEKHVTFQRGRNLFRISLETSEIVQLTDIREGPKRPEPKLEGNRKFLADQQQELFEIVREATREKQEREAERKEQLVREPFYLRQRQSVRGMELSADGKTVTFLVMERPDKAKRTAVPNYVTDSGYTEDIPSRTKVGDEQGGSRLAIMSVETGKVVWADSGQKDRDVSWSRVMWSEDGAHLAAVATSADHKDRWILLVNIADGGTEVLDHLHDDAWVMGRTAVGWMPDSRSIYFVSEKDGYFQLYEKPIDGGALRPLTSGKFEVFDPSISEDKTRFYFTSSEVHPGERQFYSMPISGGERTRITAMTGNNRALLSPDEKTIALIYSYSNKPPELYLMDNTPGAAARQVTLTPTAEWRSFPWVDPKVITFKARDGAEVYARVYTPEMLESTLAEAADGGNRGGRKRPGSRNRGGKQALRPGVIFVHGAGYAQNAHKYWSSYFREYMFHHILMSKGYVVMDIDYRGSSGYGRDWRTAIYRHMGGQDLDDQVDGAHWMVDNLGVDPKRIGIYGGSYGGFITLMAMFTQPDVFAAGAALRPVTDWAHYNHPYTSNILNDPQNDAEAYKQSSPIYFAEGLEGALLICHGVVDTNVHFEDSVRLAERLIELRKENWELAMFPVENHGFQRPDSWASEYKRILKLFETNLK